MRTTARSFEGAGLCFGHGTDNALDEASWLLLHALGLPVESAPDYSQALSVSQRKTCNQWIERRIKERIPVAYLTGTAWFAGHEFYCDNRALVPRSPLAEFINNDCVPVVVVSALVAHWLCPVFRWCAPTSPAMPWHSRKRISSAINCGSG